MQSGHAMVELVFHGAAQTVTGSCMELIHQGRHLLVDCGLFQGSRSLERLNREPFGFRPDRIEGVILTHAHIDHSGLLPRLVAEGFSGHIWCTRGSADLLTYMLPDAARIQESDAASRNRRNDRADEPRIEPLYTQADAERALELLRPVAFDDWVEPLPGMRARFWNAGHILGSASVELQCGDMSVLFSGDLGPVHKAFHPDPTAPAALDHVICESTYGDREKPDITIDQRRALLESEIKTALAQGGNLIIPVFAIERTQELLLDIASLINHGRLAHQPVFIDSPLASRATAVFARHSRDLEDMGHGEIFRHPAFHYVESATESMRLNAMSGAVILAASGMCEGGRIRHHLIHNLARNDSTILFVGYQAEGTLGRTILGGASRVRISGHDLAVRAQIRQIDSYSAHADKGDLLAWIDARQPIAGSLFLTHGEAQAIAALREAAGTPSSSIIAPAIGERYRLTPKTPARRLSTGKIEVQKAIGRDWQNDYADFAVNLKQRLKHIGEDKARIDAIRQMHRILDDFSQRHTEQRQNGTTAKEERL